MKDNAKTKVIIGEIEKAISEFKNREDYDKYKVLLIGARIDPVVEDEDSDDDFNFDMLSLEVFVGAYTSIHGEGEHTIYHKEETFSKNDNNQVDVFVELTEHYASTHEDTFSVEVSALGTIRFFTPGTPYMSHLEYFEVAVDESKKDGWIYGGIVCRVPIIL